MILFYDRAGNPLTVEQWSAFIERQDPEYKRVAETTVDDVWISTVWLGINYAFNPDHPPLIFETMVFGGPYDQEWMERYSTMAQADQGHREMVDRVIAYKGVHAEVEELFKNLEV